MKVSTEILYHFQCEVCRGWFTVADAQVFLDIGAARTCGERAPSAGTADAGTEAPDAAATAAATGTDTAAATAAERRISCPFCGQDHLDAKDLPRLS